MKRDFPAITIFPMKRGNARIYSDRNYCNQRFAFPSVGGFGKPLPGGNADKKCDDKINEMSFRKSHAPNHSCHVAAAAVTTVRPQLRKCIVGGSFLLVEVFKNKFTFFFVNFNFSICWCIILFFTWLKILSNILHFVFVVLC